MRAGRIELDNGFILGAATSEAALLDALKGDARPLVHNGEHRSYLLPRVTLGGRTFTPTVYFRGQSLTAVQLSWFDPDTRGGSVWEDYSFEREHAIAAADASWLARYLGGSGLSTETYRFAWGSIWSGFDEKGGFSSIIISYSQAPP